MLYPLIAIALMAAPLALVARFPNRDRIAWGLALIPLAIFGLTLAQAGPVWEGGIVQERLPWAPTIGLAFSFTLDGLSLLFALIITGIGTLIVGYAGHYLNKDSGLGRFLAYLMLFMGAMLGVVLAGNVLTMFVFWELTSVTSYLLIGYKHDYADARQGALFLGYYVAYTAYLILAATEHDALPVFSSVMGAFALPMTGVTLAVLALNALRQRRQRAPEV